MGRQPLTIPLEKRQVQLHFCSTFGIIANSVIHSLRGLSGCGGRVNVVPLLDITMRTRGEVEAAISDGIARFEQEYMGRGPKQIHTHLIGDLLMVRLQGVLTAAEQ